MTKQELARKVRDDFGWYAAQFLKIKTKDARIAPLRLKSVQRKIDALWQKAKAERKPLRLYILKARREGVSTHTDARIFHRTSTRTNRNAFIVAHEDATSVALFDMVRLFRDELRAPLRPMERYSSRRELVFENPDDATRKERPGLRSRLSIGTARNVDVGKGTLVHDLHCPEFAFYRDPQAFLNSITPTVPDLPDTSIVLETTPDSAGSYANQLWNDSKEGKTPYTPLFLAWYDDDEYQVPFTSAEAKAGFLASLSDEERAAQAAYKLSPEQLQWRRREIAKYSSPAAFFNQHPENDVDCWLFSGRGVFPTDALKRQAANLQEPKWVGDIVEEADGTLRFDERPDGPLRVWEWAKEEVPVIGVDVAEGLKDGDFSAAQVLLPSSKRQIAEWHGHTDPDLLADVLYRLGWYFKEALIGVEVNNHGFTTLTALKKRYGRLYYRSLPKPNDPSQDQEQKLGWKTDSRTKPQMEDLLLQHLRDDAIVLRSKQTLSELQSYVVHDDGSTGANSGSYDDRGIALMIALKLSQNSPADPAKAAIRKARRRRLLNQFSR